MNLRTEISLLGRLSIETVLLTVYLSQPQRAFTSKSSLHNYRPLRFSRCSHAQQKVLLSSFSASDNVLVTYVFTFKRRGCQIFSTLRTGGPLADGRQVGLDRAPDLGSGLMLMLVLMFFYAPFSPRREAPKNAVAFFLITKNEENRFPIFVVIFFKVYI
jgi:hypothetical protein